MQIKTRVQELTPNELIRITLYYQMKWFWLVCLCVLLIGAWHGLGWLIFFSVVFPVFLVLGVRRSLNSKANRVFYAKRHYEMDDQFLHTYMEDGGMSKLAWDHFHRALKFRKYCLLFLSEIQFFLIPDSLFYTDADRQAFEAFLLERKLLKPEKEAMGWPLRLAWEGLFLLVWLMCVGAALFFYFTQVSDNVTAYLLSFLVLTYPVFQAARLLRLFRKS